MASEKTSLNLFPETVALAIWVIFYTFISTLCALFTHILFRLNKQKAAYVSLTCIAICLQQLVTIVQQMIALVRWPQIQKEVWQWDLDMWGKPNASTIFISSPDKWYFAFIFPGLVSIIINLPQTREHATAHLILLDFILVVTISCGIIFLLLILTKFILVAIEGQRSRKRQRIRVHDDRPLQKSSKEDKWIILRFLAGFIIIGALQAAFLYSQYEYAQHVIKLRNPATPLPPYGWTKKKQLGDWAYYMAGSSTGFLIILIFGTTPDSRTQAKRLLRRWFRCSGFGRRGGKQQMEPTIDTEKATGSGGAGDTKIVFPSCNVKEIYYDRQFDEPFDHSTFSSSHSSIAPLMQAPAPVAVTPTLHHHSQNSRLSRPPTDTMFPEAVPIDDAFPPTAFRSVGTSYEEEYYQHEDTRISIDSATSEWAKRERDVVISTYDYRNDGLGRNGTLLRHCVSPLTPDAHTFEQFRIHQQPIEQEQLGASHYPVGRFG